MGIGRTMAVPTLAVTDLDGARRFYGSVLGFEELAMEAGEEGTAFRVGDGSYLYVYRRPKPSGSSATACAFVVEDVEGTVARLQSQGVRFEDYDIPEMGLRTVNGIATMGGYKGAWFKDPSGNILAIENSMVEVMKRGAYEGAHP